MPAPGCLTAADLAAFHLGDLPEADLDRIAAHLESCPACEGAARALDGLSDPTLAAYRESVRTAPLPDAAARPRNVGDYEILGEIGRGGMGVVYKARHARLRRVVALKMILGGHFADREQRQRFRAEAEAVARLQHPNIVQLFEAGEHEAGDGVPRSYFTLEFVEGGGLDRRLDAGPLAPAQAAAWLEALARAVHYAHDRGIIHRDLKPSNVLLTADGRPKVCDFGVAKLVTDSDHETLRGTVVGTAEYMAPEQAEAKGPPGPACDVYALGAILYEMLVGHPPFQGATALDTLAQVRGREPVPLRRLQPGVPRDLETICLKCLAKEPARRYASAAALADDLRRFQVHEPIAARPTRAWERLLKWARRRPAVAALAAAVVAAVALGLAGAGWGWRQAVTERANALTERANALTERGNALRLADDLRAERDAARWQTYRAEIAAAGDALQLNNVPAARRHLDAAPERFRDWEWRYFAARLDTARARLAGHSGLVRALAFPPDGRRLVSASEDRTVRLWEAATGKTLAVWGYDAAVRQMALSPDGTRVACSTASGALCLHDLSAGLNAVVRRDSGKPANFLAFTADGKRLVVDVNDGRPTVRDAATGEGRLVLSDSKLFFKVLALSPDGRWLAVGAADAAQPMNSSLILWDLAEGRPSVSLRSHATVPIVGAFSPDGRFLVTAGQHTDDDLRLWRVGPPQLVGRMPGHKGQVYHLAFSPDGSRIASASVDGTARLWDGTTGRHLATLEGHSAPIQVALFSPDGRRLVTASDDQTLRLWDVAGGKSLSVLRGHEGAVRAVAWSPDGTRLASAANDPVIRLWDKGDVERAEVLRGHTDVVSDVAFSPNGAHVLSTSPDGTLRTWDAETGGETDRVTHYIRSFPSFAVTPDGKQALCVAMRSNTAWVWDLPAGTVGRVLALPEGARASRRCAFHPAGVLAAAGGEGGAVSLWDVPARRLVARLEGHQGDVQDVAFSPDGRQVASAGSDGLVFLWDVESRQRRAVLRGHDWKVLAVTYSADGRLLATGGYDQTARVWDAATGAEVACLRHDSAVAAVRFHPGGTRLAAGCADGTIRLWDLATREEAAELRGHTAYVFALAFSPDGTRLASGSADFTVRLWDTNPPKRERPK